MFTDAAAATLTVIGPKAGATAGDPVESVLELCISSPTPSLRDGHAPGVHSQIPAEVTPSSYLRRGARLAPARPATSRTAGPGAGKWTRPCARSTSSP